MIRGWKLDMNGGRHKLLLGRFTCLLPPFSFLVSHQKIIHSSWLIWCEPFCTTIDRLWHIFGSITGELKEVRPGLNDGKEEKVRGLRFVEYLSLIPIPILQFNPIHSKHPWNNLLGVIPIRLEGFTTTLERLVMNGLARYLSRLPPWFRESFSVSDSLCSSHGSSLTGLKAICH